MAVRGRARIAVEVGAGIAGLVAAYCIGWASAWSYPLGRADIWLVTYVSMAVVAVLGVRQVQRALTEERAGGGLV